MPFIASQLRTACRIDVVWDRYDSICLKATVRECRGIGICRHVTRDTPIPAPVAEQYWGLRVETK